MHRNTLLVVAFLAIIAALLIGINVGRSISPSLVPTPTPVPSPTVAFVSQTACGVAFRYPNTLTAMESSISGTILVNTTKPDDSIVIICQKDIPRVALPSDKTEKISIGSVSATLYHDANQKDGTPIDKLIFTHPKTKLDVFIAGFGPVFSDLIASLKLE